MWRLLGLLVAAVLAAPAQVIVLQNATIIDGTGGAPIANGSVVISNGKIEAIGPSSQVKAPAQAQVADLSGKYIMPGIINLHGHVGMTKGLVQDIKNYTRANVDHNLRLYAQYGVTTTTSMGSDADLILEVRDEQRRGKVSGARVFTGLQGFTAIDGYPTRAPGMKGVAQEVATAAQARAWVDKIADKNTDIVKMWVDDHHDKEPKLTPALYGAIIDQAHKRKKMAFAHIYELADAKGLVAAGIDMLGHSVRDAEVDAELIAAMKKRNVTYVATFTREESTFVYADSPAWLDDVFFTKGVSPDVIQALKTSMKATQAKDPERKINIEGLKMAMRNLKKLSDAGVRIGFGTDTGPPGRFPGYFEHWEMELMAEAGLTPMQIIQAFSKNAAETLGAANELGTLVKGHAADLVVLDKNPLENIKNSRSIAAVYLAGRKIE
jgi:imidazolonepropionase-like amidohydrolase